MASSPSTYPRGPRPTTLVTAMSWSRLTRRNGSRVDGSVRWTSTNGRATPSRASRSATLVWVRPPALTIAPSKLRWCSRSMIRPSWFDWKKSTDTARSAARARTRSWIWSSVSDP